MIYVIKCEGTGHRKIGMTVNIRERLKSLQIGSASKLTLEFVAEGGRVEEIRLHEAFADRRVHSEWFKISAADVLAQSWAGFSPPEPFVPKPTAPAAEETPVLARPREWTAEDEAVAELCRAELVKLEPLAIAVAKKLTRSCDPEVAKGASEALQRHRLRGIGQELARLKRFVEAQRGAA